MVHLFLTVHPNFQKNDKASPFRGRLNSHCKLMADSSANQSTNTGYTRCLVPNGNSSFQLVAIFSCT